MIDKKFLNDMTNKWKAVFQNPKKTFSKQLKKANFKTGATYMLIAGLIAGVIQYVFILLGLSVYGLPSTQATTTGLRVIIGLPVSYFLGWVIWGGIVYMFSRLFKGKGTYVQQLSLTALYLGPLAVAQLIVSIVPVVGGVVSFALTIYGLYLLTLLLKITHKYSTAKAVWSWLLPFIIGVILLLVVVFGLISVIGLDTLTELAQVA